MFIWERNENLGKKVKFGAIKNFKVNICGHTFFSGVISPFSPKLSRIDLFSSTFLLFLISPIKQIEEKPPFPSLLFPLFQTWCKKSRHLGLPPTSNYVICNFDATIWDSHVCKLVVCRNHRAEIIAIWINILE